MITEFELQGLFVAAVTTILLCWHIYINNGPTGCSLVYFTAKNTLVSDVSNTHHQYIKL
jgi:hypothetical protein